MLDSVVVSDGSVSGDHDDSDVVATTLFGSPNLYLIRMTQSEATFVAVARPRRATSLGGACVYGPCVVAQKQAHITSRRRVDDQFIVVQTTKLTCCWTHRVVDYSYSKN